MKSENEKCEFGRSEPWDQFSFSSGTPRLRVSAVNKQDDVGLLGNRSIEASDAIRSGDDAVIFGGKRVRQRGAHRSFIFNDQDARHTTLPRRRGDAEF